MMLCWAREEWGSSRPVIKIYCFSSPEPVGGERIVLTWSSCVLLVILLSHFSTSLWLWGTLIFSVFWYAPYQLGISLCLLMQFCHVSVCNIKFQNICCSQTVLGADLLNVLIHNLSHTHWQEWDALLGTKWFVGINSTPWANLWAMTICFSRQ
jgi:hypothetical protein